MPQTSSDSGNVAVFVDPAYQNNVTLLVNHLPDHIVAW